MFGGADPAIRGLVPSNIVIRRNLIRKPLAWRGRWTVKNLLELKSARRVRIEDNVFENNWVDGQNGAAILFTVRNQDGNAPWSTVATCASRATSCAASGAASTCSATTTGIPAARPETC